MPSLTTDIPTALVTGASSGIGEAFARRLAADGHDVVLVARTKSRLDALAAELREKHEVAAIVIAKDLTEKGAAADVLAEVTAAGRHIDLLVNNAGFATHGSFTEISPERDVEQVTLDVTAVVDFCHAFLPGMAERGTGSIINVSSTAGFQPLPYMAVYGASKAFVISFGEALRFEAKKHGVKVLTLCPGPTDTPFHELVGEEAGAIAKKVPAEKVVDVALKALAKGRGTVVVGRRLGLLSQLPRLLPLSTAASISGKMLERQESPAAGQDLVAVK